jgi:hypothetical protein
MDGMSYALGVMSGAIGMVFVFVALVIVFKGAGK